MVTAKISKTKSFVFRVLFFSKFAVYFCGCLQANVSDPVFITSLLLLSEPAKEEHSNPKGWNGCNARIVKGDRFYGAICLVDTYDDCSSSTFNDIVTDTQRLDFVFNLDIHELAYPECKAPIFVLRNIYSGTSAPMSFFANHIFSETGLKATAISFYSSCDNLPWDKNEPKSKDLILVKSYRLIMNKWQVHLAITDGVSASCLSSLNLNTEEMELVNSLKAKRKVIGKKCIYDLSLNGLRCEN
ncbi:hypothetical protein [Leptospira kobayashii]|uniref:hypothetical protein n=1 Tax=Leptospira kobayashii TaxID=1917830 RepID=UPI000D597861|nr:hypothetical protein [Leptospira kobayashii]